MKKVSISDILNEINIKELKSFEIDNKNKLARLELLDEANNIYHLELLGVDNYHFLDEYIYHNDHSMGEKSGLRFYDSMPWEYMCLTYNSEGELLKQNKVTPNFVVNSKDRSICLKVSSAKLDGNYYPIFKSSFLSE